MMDFDECDRLVPFEQLCSPPDDDDHGNHNEHQHADCPTKMKGRRATMSIMQSPSFFRSPAGFDFLTLSARKRKRKQDEDNLSVQSLDVTSERSSSAGKRLRKSLSRVISLVNLASPVKPVKKLGGSLQRSLSFKNVLSPSVNKINTTAYKKPVATPTKRRPSKLWQETVDGDVTNIFSEMQIKRQNAIFELYQCEEDLVQDLCMVKSLYHDSLKKLGLMSDEELLQVFGMIETLTPLHQDLAARLLTQKQPDGSTDKVGRVLLDWIPGLLSYIPYCANQIFAKELLDRKRNDKHVQDFLQRCQESPFSRKLDLWTFLDIPRSRLVKYPLLFRNIQSRTPASHEDIALLEEAIHAVEEIIHEVDNKTGEAKCRFFVNRLEYLEEAQHHPVLDDSKVLLLDGVLRNNRGTKLNTFLFDKALVLTRPTTRHDRQCYQVYRYPLALSELLLEDLKDGEVKMGSFRNMLGQGQGSKHVLRVTWPGQIGKHYTHTLQARDEHDKKQWLNSITQGIEQAKLMKERYGPESVPVPIPLDASVISDDESEELDGSPNKENAVSLAEVAVSPLRKRSLSRRPSDCSPACKRTAPTNASPAVVSGVESTGTLKRSESTCILTTPSLSGERIPYADDSSGSDDNVTPIRRRSRTQLVSSTLTPATESLGLETPIRERRSSVTSCTASPVRTPSNSSPSTTGTRSSGRTSRRNSVL